MSRSRERNLKEHPNLIDSFFSYFLCVNFSSSSFKSLSLLCPFISLPICLSFTSLFSLFHFRFHFSIYLSLISCCFSFPFSFIFLFLFFYVSFPLAVFPLVFLLFYFPPLVTSSTVPSLYFFYSPLHQIKLKACIMGPRLELTHRLTFNVHLCVCVKQSPAFTNKQRNEVPRRTPTHNFWGTHKRMNCGKVALFSLFFTR